MNRHAARRHTPPARRVRTIGLVAMVATLCACFPGGDLPSTGAYGHGHGHGSDGASAPTDDPSTDPVDPTATGEPSPSASDTPSETPTAVATPTPTPTPTQTPSPSTRPTSRPSATPTASRPPSATATPTSPPAGARPGASNTGVPAGVTLTASGALTVTKAGAVIDSLDITGGVTVEAKGVVIKNSRIHGSGSGDGIRVESGNVTIYDSEIYGFENAIGYSDWTAYRVNIHSDTGDGVKLGSNTTLQDSWIHDLAPGPDAHADGGQVQDGVTNLVVRHNTIDLSADGSVNSALFIQPIFGPSTAGPVLIEDNYLSGGGYTIFVLDGSPASYLISNITVRNNVFGRAAQYGPDLVSVPVTWTNNRYANGEVVTASD